MEVGRSLGWGPDDQEAKGQELVRNIRQATGGSTLVHTNPIAIVCHFPEEEIGSST